MLPGTTRRSAGVCVVTRGTATARLRAPAGPVAPITSRCGPGLAGPGVSELQQAPTWYLPRRSGPSTTTAKPVTLATRRAVSRPAAVRADRLGGESGANIVPAQGPILTDATTHRARLPAESEVSVVWERRSGNRVESSGCSPQGETLGTGRVAAEAAPLPVHGARRPGRRPPDTGARADGAELAARRSSSRPAWGERDPGTVRRGEHVESSSRASAGRSTTNTDRQLRQRVAWAMLRLHQPGRRAGRLTAPGARRPSRGLLPRDLQGT